jgi:glycerol-3-phosphate responsive antiterminator
MTAQTDGTHFTLSQAFDRSPIIAAVKDEEQLKLCLTSDCAAVFLLFGNICTISGLVELVKKTGKLAFVHMEFIDGLALREISVSFIQQYTQADGILSTKPALIRRAKELGLTAVQRFFLIDSIAFENVQKQLTIGQADYVEVLPAVLPKILRSVCEAVNVPVIASGLITDKEDVLTALDCGAAAISSTKPQVWFM